MTNKSKTLSHPILQGINIHEGKENSEILVIDCPIQHSSQCYLVLMDKTPQMFDYHLHCIRSHHFKMNLENFFFFFLNRKNEL